ncbi:NAD(P)H-binding protein [Acinetobacter nematophilus]|uniref:NAD(P)H-binding protein n=1 Tax=Acinetobacter nematophilus TaxID=2994642 RepID=A0A9X3DSK4_9GAMM|nr:NAD(P)H-binding protein [Acinetobacter nematophilus]MCX5467730.1 NAD(P)H-binding protein [Acinetobacter nematophilus]
MHILFIGYGKTSQRVAKQIFEQDHQITTVSRSPKVEDFAQHLIQDIHELDLSHIQAVDMVYVALAPSRNASLNTLELYQHTYVDSVQPIVQALRNHPVKRIIVVSSTRVYGENQGELITDDSVVQPSDGQGRLLVEMEQLWQQAYPAETVIVRPTGIYGVPTERMVKLAETTRHYPNLHWSNRIHIDDLANFLAYLLHVERPEKSYICTNNKPQPLHEKILNLQRELNLPELVLESNKETGKKIFAERMPATGFKLIH